MLPMRPLSRILAVLACIFALSTHPSPRLIPDGTVAGDLRSLGAETWDAFLAAVYGRAACFGSVHLHADQALHSRAAYDPATATVTVKVPATAAMLREGMIHEWAHHMEYQCASQRGLRAAFLAAQRLPADIPWQTDYLGPEIPQSEWARIPSEQYAEGVVELVLGERQIPTTIRVRREALAVIAAWASGR